MAAIMYFPALLPYFQAQWGLTNTEAGWINGIYFGGYAVSGPLLVTVTDRVDARKIFMLSAGLGALSMIGFGWLCQGMWTAAVFRLMAGIALAGTYMPGLKALTDRITGEGQSRAVAFYTSSFGIGSALSVFLAGWLTDWLGWRWAAGVMALAPLLAILLFALKVEPKKPVASNPETARPFWDFRPALKNRPALGYTFGYAVHCWVLFGFRSWLVAFLFFSLSLQPTDLYRISPQNLVTIIFLLGVPASILGNEGALRWGRQRAITAFMLISSFIGIVFGFSARLPFMAVAGLGLAYSVAVMADSGSLTAGLVSAARMEERGRTMAFYTFVGFGMAFLAPLAFGAVLDVAGSSIIGWGLAFATLSLVEMSGPFWLRRLRAEK
ncbi:MAG: MFS transporter [Proteobacteria bacterium]|nr:MFS transporter [Pseudomonadota bacterium]